MRSLSSTKASFSTTMVAAIILLFFSGTSDDVLADHVGNVENINWYKEYGFYQLVSECLSMSSVGNCPTHWYSVQQGGKRYSTGTCP
jgi:hypothetical protein